MLRCYPGMPWGEAPSRIGALTYACCCWPGWLAAGNHSGEVYVFDAASGARCALVSTSHKVWYTLPYQQWAPLLACTHARKLSVCNGKPNAARPMQGMMQVHVHVPQSRGGQPQLWLMGRLTLLQVAGPVRAVALSNDCRHLLAVAGNGFLFRQADL